MKKHEQTLHQGISSKTKHVSKEKMKLDYLKRKSEKK